MEVYATLGANGRPVSSDVLSWMPIELQGAGQCFKVGFRLCWQTQQTFLWPHVWMHHPWSIWTTCATWSGSRYRLMLPVGIRTLAEHKTREESVRTERAISCYHHMQNHSLVGVVLRLPLHCTFCHFHLHQSDLKTDSPSLLLPKWNDWFSGSLTDSLLYCDD